MPGSKNVPAVEPVHHHHSHLLCWKSISAGLLIAVMTHMILSTLGVAVVGVAAQSAIENEQGGRILASGTGLWMGISAIASIFLGSYFTVRISKSVTHKVGAAHGLVVSSAFFIILTVVAASAIGSLSMGLGNLVSGLGQSATSVASNSRVQDTINQALGSANLRSDPRVVSEGIAVRLLQGDVASAKSYYAYQSGLSEAEVNSRIDTLNANFIRIAKEVGDKAAETAAATGISLFVLFALGVVSGGIAGRYAAHANVEHPLEAADTFVAHQAGHAPIFASQRGSALPYIFAWILGVPATILFLIFALRTVF